MKNALCMFSFGFIDGKNRRFYFVERTVINVKTKFS